MKGPKGPRLRAFCAVLALLCALAQATNECDRDNPTVFTDAVGRVDSRIRSGSDRTCTFVINPTGSPGHIVLRWERMDAQQAYSGERNRQLAVYEGTQGAAGTLLKMYEASDWLQLDVVDQNTFNPAIREAITPAPFYTGANAVSVVWLGTSSYGKDIVFAWEAGPCSGTVDQVGEQGFIADSGDLTQRPAGGTTCTWTLHTQDDNNVDMYAGFSLYFTRFDLSDGSTLEVFDATGGQLDSLASWDSTSVNPGSWWNTASAQVLEVRFTTGTTPTVGAGIEIDWRARSCHNVVRMHAPSGKFTDSSLPSAERQSAQNVFCAWQITPEEGDGTLMINLRQTSTYRVQVFEGPIAAADKIIFDSGVWSSYENYVPQVATYAQTQVKKSALVVYYPQYPGDDDLGFEIEYDLGFCDAHDGAVTIYGRAGTLSNSGGSGAARGGATCTWTLVVDTYDAFSIFWDRVDLQAGVDYITITTQEGEQVARVTGGDDLVPVYVPRTKELTIVYTTGATTTGTGFEARYSVGTGYQQHWTGEDMGPAFSQPPPAYHVTSAHGVLTDGTYREQYTTFPYQGGGVVLKRWIVEPTGTPGPLELFFDRFVLGPRCAEDKCFTTDAYQCTCLRIYDGTEPEESSRIYIPPTLMPSTIVAPSGSMLVEWTAASGNTNNRPDGNEQKMLGWEAHFESRTCHLADYSATMTGSIGELFDDLDVESPVRAGAHCEWELVAPTDANSVFSVFPSHLDITGDPAHNYLRVYDVSSGSGAGILKREYTADSAPSAFAVHNVKKLRLEWSTGAADATGTGFHLKYEVNACDGDVTVTALSGDFSDGSPTTENMAKSLQCGWRLLPDGAPADASISLTITRLDMWRDASYSEEDPSSQLRVYDSDQPDADKLISRVYGFYSSTILSTGPKMYIALDVTAYSDSERQTGFDAHYETGFCHLADGVQQLTTTVQGRLTNNPDSTRSADTRQRASSTCTWEIHLPDRQSDEDGAPFATYSTIAVYFTELKLGAADKIQFVDLTTSAVLHEVTATDTPPYVRLERRQSVKVVYTTGAEAPGYGFDAYWSGSSCIAEPALHGGVVPLYAPSGIFTDGSGMGIESYALPTPQFYLEQETSQVPYCSWELHPTVPDDVGITFVVRSLDTKSYSDNAPNSPPGNLDTLSVLDGIAGTTVVGKWGGTDNNLPFGESCNDHALVLPPPMYTTLPNARVKWSVYAMRQGFSQQQYTRGMGFSIEYYGGFCEHDLSGTNEPQHMELSSWWGSLRTSVKRDGAAPPASRPHAVCSWQLPSLPILSQGSDDLDSYNAMTIYFTRFDLNVGDRVVLEDWSTGQARYLAQYEGGGGTVPVPFNVDRTTSLRVRFEAGANPGTGFEADYHSGHCMGHQTVKSSSGSFTDGSRSDRAPSGGVSTAPDCTWLVQPTSAKPGDVVDVFLERYSARYYNRLRLYDGPSATDELVVWDSNDLGYQGSSQRPHYPEYASFNFTTSAALFFAKFEQAGCYTSDSSRSRGFALRYCIQGAPVVDGTIPDTGIPTIGGVVDLVGTNFCPIGLDVLVGGHPCQEPVEWISNERVRCKVGPGKGTGVPVSVHANGRVSAPGVTIRYAKPELTRITPSRGRTSGGYPVTLLGANFGYRAYEGDEAVRVFFKSDVQASYEQCANVTWVSDSEIVCESWLHGVGNVEAYVELASQPSDVGDDVLFAFDPPRFTSIIPDTAAAERGGNVRKIYGENFGRDTPITMTCTVGGTPCTHIGHVSDTELTVVLPAGKGSNALVIVIDGHTVENTNGLQIRYAAPALVSIDPPSALRGETTSIDVHGDGFAEGYTAKCRFEVFNSSLPIEVDAQWNNGRSAFVCALPTFAEYDDADGNLMNECGSEPLFVRVSLRLDGDLLAQSLDFVRYDSCVSATDGIVPLSSRLGSSTPIAVHGGGFFSSPDIVCLWWRDDAEGEVEHSETTSGTYSASNDVVTCSAPGWDEAGHARVSMALNGHNFQPKGGLDYVFYPDNARMASLRPRTGSKNGNTAVTLSGPGIVPTRYPACKFGDGVVVDGVHNGEGVVCPSPRGPVGESVLVDVALNGQDWFGLPKPFSYFDVPVTLDKVSPDSGVYTGGTRLTLTGTNLVQTNEVRVRFGGEARDAVVVSPDDVRNGKVYVRAPEHAVEKDVVVELSLNDGERWSDAKSAFTYTEELTIYSHTPLFGRTTGGELVRALGANFLNTEFSLCRMLPFDGNDEAVQTAPRAVSDDGTQFECIAPSATEGDYDLQFTNNGQEWTNTTAKYTYYGCPVGQIQETYDAPCIKCPAGTHNNVTGRLGTACDKCRAGYFSFEGAENCRPCALGHYKKQDSPPEAPCTACPSTQYMDEEGAWVCKECPDSTTVTHGEDHFGGVDLTECLCQPDYFSETGEPGVACKPCPAGALCKGGLEQPTGRAGFFAEVSKRNGKLTFFECSPRESCEEGNVCARGYTGFLCGDCLDGFYHSSGECVQCNDLGANIFLLVVGLPLSFFFVYLIKPFISKIGVKMAIDYYQILALFGRLSNVWPQSVDSGMNVFGFAYFSFDFLQFQCYSGTINYFTKWMVTVMMPVFVTVGLVIAYFAIREFLKRRADKSVSLAAKREALLGGGGRQRAVSVFRKKGEEVRLALRADLVEPYKETAPWWEVMIIVQKLVLVLVINFVGNTDAKLLFLEFMVLWWVFCQHIFMPFKSRTDWNKIHTESEEEKAELRAEMEAELLRQEVAQRKAQERGGPSSSGGDAAGDDAASADASAGAGAGAGAEGEAADGLGALGHFVRGGGAGANTVSVNLGSSPVAPVELPEHPRTEAEHFAVQHPLLKKHMQPGWKGLPFRVYANVAPWAGNYNMLQYVLLLGVALTLFGGSVYRSSESPAHAPKFVWFIMSMSMIYVAPFIYCDCIEGYMERREEVRKESRALDEFGKQRAKTKTLEERLLLFYFSFLQLIYMQITTVPFEVFDCTTQDDGSRTINAAPANECAELSDFYPAWIGLLGGLFWGFGILFVDLWVVHGSLAAMKESMLGAAAFAKAAWDDRFTATKQPIAHMLRGEDGSTYLQMVDEKNLDAENAAL